MTERERLIELLMQGELEADKQGVFNCSRSEWKAEIIADFLLESGVRVPPVVVGATVYEFRHKARYNGRRTDSGIDTKRMLKMAVSRGDDIYISAKPYAKSDFLRLGNTIFLTLEEADEELQLFGIKNAARFV